MFMVLFITYNTFIRCRVLLCYRVLAINMSESGALLLKLNHTCFPAVQPYGRKTLGLALCVGIMSGPPPSPLPISLPDGPRTTAGPVIKSGFYGLAVKTGSIALQNIFSYFFAFSFRH